MISKNVKLGILTILISAGITLFMAEIMFKAAFWATIEYWGEFVPDEKVSWKLKPNHKANVEWIPGVQQVISSNELGLRDTLNPNQIDHNKPVIMVQGDSNILGYGIKAEQMYSQVIQNNFSANNLVAQVINGGTSGYDLQHYLFQMEELHEIYKPNYNFIVFNLNNDYLSSLLSTSYSYSRRYYDLKNGSLELHEREYRVPAQAYGLKFVESLSSYQEEIISPFWSKKNKPTLSGIWAQSYLAYGIYSRLINRKFFKDLFETRNTKTYDEETYNHSLLRISYFMFDPNWSEPYRSGHKLIEKLFESYFRFKNTKTIVVILPPRSEVIEYQQTKEIIAKLSHGKMIPDFDIEYSVITNSLDKLGIPYINLRKEFMNYPNKDDLYFKNNEHITPIGHKILGDAISNYVLKFY